MEAITAVMSVFDQRQKLRLLPFVVTSAFFLVQPYPQASFLGVIFKILPILSLIGYVIVTRSQFPRKTKAVNIESLLPEDTYSVCILAGLVFSLFGDILVTIPYMMLPGGTVFIIAHLCYFIGIEISGRHKGTRCGRSSSASLFVLLFLNTLLCTQSCVDSYAGKVAVALYFIPLFAVGWKAAAALEENPGDTAVLMACVGASAFIMSDFLVILDHYEFPIICAEHLFMLMYYGAQFGWAVSTSNFK